MVTRTEDVAAVAKPAETGSMAMAMANSITQMARPIATSCCLSFTSSERACPFWMNLDRRSSIDKSQIRERPVGLNSYSDNLEGRLQAKQRFIHEMNQRVYLVSGRPVGGGQRCPLRQTRRGRCKPPRNKEQSEIHRYWPRPANRAMQTRTVEIIFFVQAERVISLGY